jgi:hypothetical protein
LKIIKTITWHHLSAWQLGESDTAEWMPPPFGSFKVNFDVAIRPTFAVAAATLGDHSGNFLAVNSLIIIAIKDPLLFSDWTTASIISDI